MKDNRGQQLIEGQDDNFQKIERLRIQILISAEGDDPNVIISDSLENI